MCLVFFVILDFFIGGEIMIMIREGNFGVIIIKDYVR
jgi:hypothetical protein